MTKRILTLLLALSLLLGCVPVQAAVLSTEEQYQAALDELRSYVTGDREVSLQDVFNQFSSLSYYRHSEMLTVYTRILLDIENEDFGKVNQYIGYMRKTPDFCAFVSAEEEPLGSVDELEWYAKARQAESVGDMQQAMAYYQNCPAFMDSMLRFMSMDDEELEKKYQEAIRYYNMNTPEGYQKAYELFLELDGYKDSNNYLTMADLFRATPKPAATPKPTAKPTPKPTTKPAAKPTAKPTPKPTWSSWSGWSEANPGSNTSTREVEKKTQYRYKTASTSQQWGAYGAWSDWSETAVSETDSRDVETKQDTKTTTTYKYKYSRWLYTRTDGVTGSSYAEYYGTYYKSNGRWQTKTTTSPLKKAGTSGGHQRYNSTTDSWWNEEKIPVNTSTTVTLYRYRTRSLENVTNWSNWSSWQDASVASSSTCQVETRTVYRYRTLK